MSVSCREMSLKPPLKKSCSSHSVLQTGGGRKSEKETELTQELVITIVLKCMVLRYIFYCSRSNQMPWTDQITEISSYVHTYLQSLISTIGQCHKNFNLMKILPSLDNKRKKFLVILWRVPGTFAGDFIGFISPPVKKDYVKWLYAVRNFVLWQRPLNGLNRITIL